jgi:hypothetical protein
VAALHQELKDQHPKPKPVLLGLAVDLVEGPALKLGRCVLQLTDRAEMDHRPEAAVFFDLK